MNFFDFLTAMASRNNGRQARTARGLMDGSPPGIQFNGTPPWLTALLEARQNMPPRQPSPGPSFVGQQPPGLQFTPPQRQTRPAHPQQAVSYQPPGIQYQPPAFAPIPEHIQNAWPGMFARIQAQQAATPPSLVSSNGGGARGGYVGGPLPGLQFMPPPPPVARSTRNAASGGSRATTRSARRTTPLGGQRDNG